MVTIDGSMGREDRRKTQEAFTQDKEVEILVATDAAGEGINLQRAHLMINYDLPWNPNRIEQRFGRIHRIGQTEVCHLWNWWRRRRARVKSSTRCSRKLEQERGIAGRQRVRRAGRVLCRQTAARSADGGDPLWRPAGGQGAATGGRCRRWTAST